MAGRRCARSARRYRKPIAGARNAERSGRRRRAAGPGPAFAHRSSVLPDDPPLYRRRDHAGRDDVVDQLPGHQAAGRGGRSAPRPTGTRHSRLLRRARKSFGRERVRLAGIQRRAADRDPGDARAPAGLRASNEKARPETCGNRARAAPRLIEPAELTDAMLQRLPELGAREAQLHRPVAERQLGQQQLSGDLGARRVRRVAPDASAIGQRDVAARGPPAWRRANRLPNAVSPERTEPRRVSISVALSPITAPRSRSRRFW